MKMLALAACVAIACASATAQVVKTLTIPTGTVATVFVPFRGGFQPDCDGSGGVSNPPNSVNVDDFTCLFQKFAASDMYADCDGKGSPPYFNVADFTAFLQSVGNGRRDPAVVLRGTPLIGLGHLWYQCECPLPDPCRDCDDENWPWRGGDGWQATIAPDSQGVVSVRFDYPGIVSHYQIQADGHLHGVYEFVLP